MLSPFRNGAAFPATKLENLLSLPYPGPKLDIIVISDGFTGTTGSIATGFASRGVRLLRQEPSGKAAVLNLALAQASSDLLLYTDIRKELSHDCLL